jgi:DnaB-like helicase N terminal domain/AAA domain
MSTSGKPSRERNPKVQPIVGVDPLAARGLPGNLDAERFVIGSVLLDDSRWPECAALTPDDYSLQRHRLIWAAMCDLRACGDRVDRVTVAEELARRGQLGADGVEHLVSLDEGMPYIIHLGEYVRIVLGKSKLRRMIYAGQALMNECLLGNAAPDEILANYSGKLADIGSIGSIGLSIAGLPSVRQCSAGATVSYLREPELPSGCVTALTGAPASGKSTLLLAWARELVRGGIPVLILDRDNPLNVISERFARLGIADEALLRYWGGWLPEEAPMPDDPRVVEWVRSCNPRPLVIVDCAAAYMAGGDENNAGEMRKFIRRCRRLADLGATLNLVHHDGKAETAKDYRGSSDFLAAVDVAYHVSNYSSDGSLDQVRLRPYKHRFGCLRQILYHYRDGRMVRDDAPAAPAKVKAEQLTELLRRNPGIGQRDYERLVVAAGTPRRQAREWLETGVRAGEIRCERGTHNKRRYYLTVGEAS